MDVSAWSMFFSFDVMGEIGFGKDFNNLNTGVEHSAIKGVHSHMTMLGIMSTVPWLLNVLGSIPGAAAGYSEFFSFCAGQIREKHKVSHRFQTYSKYHVQLTFIQTWDSEKMPQDIVSWLLKAVKERDVSASPSAAALEDDARVVIIAGRYSESIPPPPFYSNLMLTQSSETTATTLASALFYLAKNPSTQKKLQAHLDRAMPGGYSDWSYEKVKSVSYVDDFINETLRLKPALLTGGARETPAKGIQVGDTYIPGNTNIMVPIWLIQRDERYWPEADKFVPERFGERREEMGTDKAPYLPFSLGEILGLSSFCAFADDDLGAYACPGKNLAQLSLRTSLSMIAQNFDVAFAPGEDGVTFDNEMLDTFTVTLPPLQLQFTPRNFG